MKIIFKIPKPDKGKSSSRVFKAVLDSDEVYFPRFRLSLRDSDFCHLRDSDFCKIPIKFAEIPMKFIFKIPKPCVRYVEGYIPIFAFAPMHWRFAGFLSRS
jgi:hypothetical protein